MSEKPLYRKLAIALSALAVCVVPTACTSAYAATGEHAAHSVPAALEADGDGQAGDAAAKDADQQNADQQNADQENADQQNADQENADQAGQADAAKQNQDQQNPPNIDVAAPAADVQNPGGQVPDPANPAGESTDPAGVTGKNADAEVQALRKGTKPGGKNNGLDVLGRDCKKSKLPPHDGFQNAPRCVSTAFGEVAAAEKSPSLLITKAPNRVRVGQDFTLEVSTRNLVRDRFLGAAVGGYYLEASFLNGQGLQRGHFHTACRMLAATNVAPDSSLDPEFFVATQDNKGGAAPDTVKITVPGIKKRGVAQCTSWGGDGSHRVPMMQRANQTPAIDSVRITIQ